MSRTVTLARTVTLVLPVEDDHAVAGVLAPGLVAVPGTRIGVVDNGLWHAMRTFTELFRADLLAAGATDLEVVPYDHLAADFPEQQRALGPFGRRVRGAVTGLGN